MADSDNEKTKDKKEKSAEGKIGIVTWLIMIVVILGLSGSGFILGRLVAGSVNKTPPPADTAATGQIEDSAVEADPETGDDSKEAGKTWYYKDMDSVVVNPDEPGATRFVRVGLILEMDSGLSEEDAKKLIEGKQPLMINWLNLYFKGLSLDQMEDEKDMSHILAQITDAFNEILFSESKPLLKRTLIREFNIQ